MLRFQVESVKDFKWSTWLTLMEGLEQPWTIKLLEKATEPATFAISRKVTNKVLSSHSHSLFIKKLGTLERDTLICKFLAPTCSMQVHENSVPCIQYHYIFHGRIVTRSPLPLLYELLARCAWANRLIYVAKWWMVCLDPSLMNWDVLIWYHLTPRLMFDLCSSWFSLSFISWGPASFMEPPLWWHWLQNLQNHRCMRCTQAALAPRWVNNRFLCLGNRCFCNSRKVNVVQSVLWISWQLDSLERIWEYLSICSRWNVRFARNDWWGMASTDFGTALNQNWPEKLLRCSK